MPRRKKKLPSAFRKARNLEMRAFTGALALHPGWLRRLYANGPIGWHGKPWHVLLAEVSMDILTEGTGAVWPVVALLACGKHDLVYRFNPGGAFCTLAGERYDAIGYPDGPRAFEAGMKPGAIGGYTLVKELVGRHGDCEGYTGEGWLDDTQSFCAAWNAKEGEE